MRPTAFPVLVFPPAGSVQPDSGKTRPSSDWTNESPRRAAAGGRIPDRERCQGAEHPAAKRCRKHWKSLTLRTGAVVLPSQLAYALPAANCCRKHWKSLIFRNGTVVLPSQLG